ncbi:MAG: hypothetical protein LKI62_09270 [Achromobacter ruhlandii]|jgi:hypothetical protein|nr:hypothetical protein [Achromobacter ruhlandii]MCI1836859.1 hypothetical protein [Achromobacter ruhlandii]
MNVELKPLILKAKIGCRKKPRLGVARCQDMAHWFSCDEATKQNETRNQGLRRGHRCALISASETSVDKEKFCGKLPTL